MGAMCTIGRHKRQPVALLNAPRDLGKAWVNRLFNPLERMYRCRLSATRL